MSRPTSTFRQADVTKAIKAVVAAGVDVARLKVEITKGGSIILTSVADEDKAGQGEDEWDRIR